jgi:hypothetical protein
VKIVGFLGVATVDSGGLAGVLKRGDGAAGLGSVGESYCAPRWDWRSPSGRGRCMEATQARQPLGFDVCGQRRVTVAAVAAPAAVELPWKCGGRAVRGGAAADPPIAVRTVQSGAGWEKSDRVRSEAAS